MGGSGSKISQEQLDKLSEQTIFAPDVLARWYKQFGVARNGANLFKKEFTDENIKFSGFGDARFWGNVFDIVDSNSSGVITFEEWVVALSALSHGDINAKMKFMFYVIDENGDGVITRGELQRIVNFIWKKNKKLSLYDTNQIFEKMDADKDNQVSRKEFTRFLATNHSFAAALDISKLIKASIFHVGTTGEVPRLSNKLAKVLL